MLFKVLVLLLIVAGAAISFGAKKIAPAILKREPEDKDIVLVKSVGLVLVFVAAVITFTIK